MSYGTSGGSAHQRMITAFFDSREDAEEAITRLEDVGVARGSIRLIPGHEQDTSRGTASATRCTAAEPSTSEGTYMPSLVRRHLGPRA